MSRDDDNTRPIKTVRPAAILLRPRRTFAHITHTEHPLDGRLVEVTGRGRGMVVYVRPVMGPNDATEYELTNNQIKEVPCTR